MLETPQDWAWECLDAIDFWGVKKRDEKYGKAYVPACGQTCDFCECPVPRWLLDVWKKRREIEEVCEAAKSVLGRSDSIEAGLLAMLTSLVCP